MEEFKRPNLPIAPSLKAEKDEPQNSIKEDLEKNNRNDATISQNPYKIPNWSERANQASNYSFEVLKSGQIIDEIKQLQKKPYWSFGRLAENDIEMAHPTISRFHAILQYRPKNVSQNSDDKSKSGGDSPPEGWYIFDLGSTHGTFLNKQRLPPKVYIRMRVGHLLKLGASTRSYILQGPVEDAEPESELSITEIKAKRQHEMEEIALEKQRLAEEAVERANNEGCSWGMAEDADEESDLTHNPYATTNNEELFLDDPKKTLRGYFEREGMELVYKCDEMSTGSFVCRVELPIDDTNGRSIVAEVVHKGKKKDCVFQCALEACRILDRHGVLRQANQEPLKRKLKSQESDSDEDEFWDRTGDVAKKKERKAAANVSVTFTYEDLLKQETGIEEQIRNLERQIDDYQKQQQHIKDQKSEDGEDGEDLDAYMEFLQDKELKFDKTEIRKLRLEEQRLKIEKSKVQRLIKIAKPAELTFSLQASEETTLLARTEINAKKQLPMIGKRKQFSKFKILNVQPNKEKQPAKHLNSDGEEIEIDENAGDKTEKHEIVTPLNKNLSVENKIEKIPEEANEKESIKDQNDTEICEDNTTLSESVYDNKKDSTFSNKKRRHRIRQRNKREDVSDDADYESSEKYAKWLPPENQTGDGLTELNKKFGY